MRNKVSKNNDLSKNRSYKSLTVFLVTLILLSTFTFFVSTSAEDKNLVDKAVLSFGVVDKASASLVFGEKNCTIKPLVFGSDKVFSEGRGQQNKVTLNSEKYNVLVEEVQNGVEYVLVVKDKMESGFVEFELDTMGYSVRQDGSLLTELPKKDYVVWNETYAFDGQNITRKDISLVGCLRFIPDGQIMEEFIIKRPYIYDSSGTWVWGEQTLNGNVLTVSVPKDFLEKAVYPIFIDPTIIFSDGFESGDFSAWTGTSANPEVTTEYIISGNYSCKMDASERLYKRINIDEAYFQFKFRYTTWDKGLYVIGDLGVFDANPNMRLNIVNDSGSPKWQVHVSTTAGEQYFTLTEEDAPTVNTTYICELYFKKDTANGAKCWIDGVEIWALTGYTTGPCANQDATIKYYNTGASPTSISYFDDAKVSDSYIGTETESLEVELNTPSNASTITDYVQNFIYTPTIIGSDSIQNASLYIDNSLVASNATAITNATANTISYTFTSNGEYEWTIGVYNSTHLVFPNGNFTITVSVNDSLTEVEESDYTTIILFVISTILCIVGLALSVPLLPLISLTISVLNIIFLSEPTIFNILLTLLNVTFTVIALVRAKTKNN